MTRAHLGALGALLSAAVAGCFLVTGGTGGYEGPADAADTPCTSASTCGDGAVCCLVPSSALTSVTGVCLASCASPSYPQLCASSPECRDAGSCAAQTCTTDASPAPVTFKACGIYPGCTAAQ